MASCHNENYDGSSSYFQKTVCLCDWWLTKADTEFEGKRLAVAGFTSRELQPVRLFTSAPIVKRYDVFTLETADGICVIVKGFINKSRTSQNGFPSEVFKHFLFGFPINWEKCAEKLLGEECRAGIESKNASDFNKSTRDPGMRDSIPNLSPCKNELKSDDKHDIKAKKDYSCNVSEKIAVDASKGCNLHNHVPNLSISVEEKSGVSNGSGVINNNHEGNADNNPSILQIECQTSVAESPAKNDVDYVKKNATGNLPPSVGCHINAVSSLEDNIAVRAEPSGHCVMGSSVRMDTPESSREGKQRTMAQSNTKGSANIELSTSPVVRNFNTLEQSGKCVDTVQSRVETNHSNPSMVSTDTENGTPNKFGSSSNRLRNLNDNQKQNRSFVKHKNKELVSEAFEHPGGEQLKGSSSHTVIHSGRKMDTSEATPSRSVGRIAKSLSGNLRSKEKKEQAAVQEECSSGNKTKRKIIFDTHETPLTQERREKVSFTSPESLSFKRSRSGRLLVPTLDFWRNQIPVYDADRRLTGIQEGSNVVKPCRVRRSERRKKRGQIT